MPTLFKYATTESRYYYLPFIELKTEAQKLTQGANVGAAIKAGIEGTYLNIIKATYDILHTSGSSVSRRRARFRSSA